MQPRGFILLFLLTCAVSTRESNRSRRSPRHERAHHRPLTHEQEADQNLQFMLSLYRSAAGPDGRPRQHRKFGSNTVRLLRPTASSVRHLPATRDHHYSFTVEYHLDTLPSEQLLRASFVHLRSSSFGQDSTPEAPRCRGQLSTLGHSSLVVLEPHERWTETDITAHVLREPTPHLTLTAQYWCSDPGHEEAELPWWSWFSFGERGAENPHVEVPSLLLYLEEQRQVKEWVGELLGGEGGEGGEDFINQIRHGLPAVRQRRSEDSALTLDALTKRSSSSTSLPSSSPSLPTSSSSLLFDSPNYKRKTGTPKNRCKLHSFRLSFEQLGWGHYFIAPPMYNPRFCRGDCPRVLPYGYNSPNHAVIQNTIHGLGLGEVPSLSCVPFKYLPLSVLVVHKKKVEYRELEDMVADSCTCR
ncbi:bone morphogenetic protein 15 [Periophthalmus magnuspinnatus]|uniref:bone morphogenetic protein 15 n=1 Tax=Periophthalmus magnuspinnatus TaxID=409849 RepID=UPI002437253B|nr:bone morphogenetic protein 15 [Periophthalmus magnuspinnatus]